MIFCNYQIISRLLFMTKPGLIVLAFALFAGVVPVLAQTTSAERAGALLTESTISSDTVDLRVSYRRGQSELELDYNDNRRQLDRFVVSVNLLRKDSLTRLRSMHIIGAASPEGSYLHNNRLALRRAESIGTYLRTRMGLDESVIKISSIGINWDGLIKAVEANEVMPYRAEVLDILRNVPETTIENGTLVTTRKNRLVSLRNGAVWSYMYNRIFPALRSSDIRVVCDIEHIIPAESVAAPEATQTPPPAVAEPEQPAEVPAETPAVAEQPATEPATEPSTVVVEQPAAAVPDLLRKKVLAFRTNLLVPFLNIGMEVPIGNRWSMGLDYYYPWLWRKADHKNCFQLLFWELEGRYWFGKKHTKGWENWQNRLTGHSVGAYVAAGYYDIGHNWTGHQGNCYSVGVDYLYGLPVAKGKLHMEFSFGVGWVHSKAQAYRVREEGGKLLRKPHVINVINYFGPTRATIAFVVPINRVVKNHDQK